VELLFTLADMRDKLERWRQDYKQVRHPMTQGKIERYHRSMKNQILLENYNLPGQLEARLAEIVDYIATTTPIEFIHSWRDFSLFLREANGSPAPRRLATPRFLHVAHSKIHVVTPSFIKL
jgi:hypothetical protein